MVLKFIFFILIFLLLSCSKSTTLTLQQDNPNSEIGYFIFKAEYPLVANSLYYAFSYYHKKAFDGPVSRIQIVATPMEMGQVSIQLQKDMCYDDNDRRCESNKKALVISGSESLSSLICLLEKSPKAICPAVESRGSYSFYGTEVSFTDDSGRNFFSYFECPVDAFPVGSEFIEGKIRDYFFEIPIVREIFPDINFDNPLQDIRLASQSSALVHTAGYTKNTIFFVVDGVWNDWRGLDSATYYQISRDANTVQYLFHVKDSLGQLARFTTTDFDTLMFDSIRTSIKNYSAESFSVRNGDPEIYRNVVLVDSTLNSIQYAKLAGNSKINFLQTKIEEWLKSKKFHKKDFSD